jgi:hypothetical protein
MLRIQSPEGFHAILATPLAPGNAGFATLSCHKELRRLREKSIALFGYYYNPGHHHFAATGYLFTAGQVNQPDKPR